jgi:hypothetical protein
VINDPKVFARLPVVVEESKQERDEHRT